MFKNNFVRYFFFIHFCFFIFSCGSTAKQHNKLPLIPAVSDDDPAIVPVGRSDRGWVDKHHDRIENVIKNQKIIFIGDSITQGFEGKAEWRELKQKYDGKITNLGFSGDQTQHVIWRLENGEYPAGINPEYVVLMIGTNNSHAPESVAAAIGKIIQIVKERSPDAGIILVSILPRGTGISSERTLRNNAVNEIIKQYDGYWGLKYLDIVQYYLNDDGSLKEELFTDKVHLTPAGYTVWIEKLTAIIK